jgi:DNA-binding NtrC family response regulator
MNMKRLLIVDDEPEILSVLKDQLEEDGIQIQTASAGKQALELCERESFDAILSDLNMPQMDGLKFLKNLRDRGNQTPFVVLTGYGDKDKAVQALKLGAFDFLEKPWSSDQLEEVVGKALELGMHIRFWKNQADVQNELIDVSKQSSEAAVSELERVIRELAQENSILRKKTGSS